MRRRPPTRRASNRPEQIKPYISGTKHIAPLLVSIYRSAPRTTTIALFLFILAIPNEFLRYDLHKYGTGKGVVRVHDRLLGTTSRTDFDEADCTESSPDSVASRVQKRKERFLNEPAACTAIGWFCAIKTYAISLHQKPFWKFRVAGNVTNAGPGPALNIILRITAVGYDEKVLPVGALRARVQG